MLTGKVLSLDIGNRNMHLIQGRSRGNMADLEISAQARTPDGAVRDGTILDSSALTKALRDLVKSSHANADRAIISIKSTNIINREITVPVVKLEELRQLVVFEMEQYVPNINNDYALGFVISDRITAGGGEQYKLRVSAAPRAMVASYSDLLKSVSLKPVIMDTPANALAKLVARNRKLAASVPALVDGVPVEADSPWKWTNAAFIDMGYELTEVNIFTGDKPVFSRLIQVGSRQMDAELITALQVDPINLDERKSKANLDISKTEDTEDEFNEIVSAHVSRWTAELQTILQFYSGRSSDAKPEVFYLYGGNAGIGGLTSYMSRVLATPVLRIQSLPSLRRVSIRRSETGDIGPFLGASAAIFRNE